MHDISHYVQIAHQQGASDIHLVSGEIPAIRKDGALQFLDEAPLDSVALETAVYAILTKEQQERFEKELELDVSSVMDGIRLRVNIHKQQGGIGVSARMITDTIPTPEELAFEQPLIQLTGLLDGLVLVVGPTGSGKSTTIASMIQHINEERKCHIITIEDPIECVFSDKKSLVEQREIGIDTHSFAASLKHVLRQDPDVIVVGEMRDPETIATVLTAAETGHLVFSTLHTSSAAEAIERIVDVFEGPKQRQILIQLASVLRGVVAQQLLPRIGGGRVAAREVLINTPAVSNLIRENNIAQIQSAMQTGAKDGMITMEQSLKILVEKKFIDQETADRRGGKMKKI